MISSQTKETQALVDDIHEGRLLLPELQRQFIWKSTQEKLKKEFISIIDPIMEN